MSVFLRDLIVHLLKATRQQSVRNTDVFTQGYPISGPLQPSSAELDHLPAMFRSYDHRVAMTVSVLKQRDVPETRTVLAQNSFNTMDLWMLQCYVNAEVDPSLFDEIFSDVSNLTS